MKILLSAYACDPVQGAEAAVGWNWARVLAGAGHEVWIITRRLVAAATQMLFPSVKSNRHSAPAFPSASTRAQ